MHENDMQCVSLTSKRNWIKSSLTPDVAMISSELKTLNKAIDLELFEMDLNNGGSNILERISEQTKKEGHQATTGNTDNNRSHTNRRNNITLNKINDAIIDELEIELAHIYGDTISFYECSYYKQGKHFMPHYDFRKERGYIRKRTILLYMIEPQLGGELRFPLLQHQIKPKQGLFVSWNNTSDNRNPDLLSLHESLVVKSGEKSLITFFQYT